MANDAFNWRIIGDDPLAGELRAASPYVPTPRELIVTTDPSNVPDGAVGTGRALLAEHTATVASPLIGLRALEHINYEVSSGDAGSLYGMFGSVRLPRGTPAGDVDQALAELLAYAFEVFHSPVEHGFARRASLIADDDAWFVTFRLVSGVLLTLEVLATGSRGDSDEVTVEITGSERVLRAEPMRQSVRLLTDDGMSRRLFWMEDRAERLLQYIAGREPEVRSGERLRDAWNLVQESHQRVAGISP